MRPHWMRPGPGCREPRVSQAQAERRVRVERQLRALARRHGWTHVMDGPLSRGIVRQAVLEVDGQWYCATLRRGSARSGLVWLFAVASDAHDAWAPGRPHDYPLDPYGFVPRVAPLPVLEEAVESMDGLWPPGQRVRFARVLLLDERPGVRALGIQLLGAGRDAP